MIKQIKLALAKKDFFEYCHIMAPDFYMRERRYLIELCDELERFYGSDDAVLIINLPPRHGKSRTVSAFVEWILGQNPQSKIITGSYNERLSTIFSKKVRNIISEKKCDADRIVYSDIFPGVKIKRGDASMNIWSLEGGYNNYLATSPTGTATGFGASLIVIDDLIKNAAEAYNEEALQKHWEWFTNTMLSRLEEGGKIIIIMTRWHSRDLAGRMSEHCKEHNIPLRRLVYKAVLDTGEMLCSGILSRKSYQTKIAAMGTDIASANYAQEPIDIRGKLYSSLKNWHELPRDVAGNFAFREVRNYTDTADTGYDYLCSICYGVYEGEAYILDVIYTKEPMEVTEPQVAKMLFENRVNTADIESNNGGRGFARSIERLLREKYNTNRTTLHSFHQSKNKESRIYSNASWVMEHVYFPPNWQLRFPEFFDAIIRYQREGKNAHDDAPDALSGIAEQLGVGCSRFSF